MNEKRQLLFTKWQMSAILDGPTKWSIQNGVGNDISRRRRRRNHNIPENFVFREYNDKYMDCLVYHCVCLSSMG